MKCLNCGKTEFEKMPLYQIHCTEGGATQLVDSYVCMHCGRIELFMPQDIINQRIAYNNKRAQQLQAENDRKKETEKIQARMAELERFLQDENNSLKELKEAQKELDEIQDKLHIKFRKKYF